MMVWNRGKSVKISKFWVSVLNFRGLIQKFYSNLWMDDVSFFFVGLGQKHHVHKKKIKLSPTQARHWLGQMSRDFCEANGEAPPLLCIYWWYLRSRPLLLMVQKSGKSPVEGKVVEIPLFTRLKIHPRWLFGISSINSMSMYTHLYYIYCKYKYAKLYICWSFFFFEVMLNCLLR